MSASPDRDPADITAAERATVARQAARLMTGDPSAWLAGFTAGVIRAERLLKNRRPAVPDGRGREREAAITTRRVLNDAARSVHQLLLEMGQR